MQAGSLTYALAVALAIALVFAAATDIRRRQIDNWLNAAIALAAPLWWWAGGLSLANAGWQLALAGITFVFTCALFVTRQMGGGDVKLLTALALWFPAEAFVSLVTMMAVLGGGGSVAMALFSMHRRPGEGLRDLVSTVIAGLFVLGCAAVAFAMVTGQPLIDGMWLGALFDAAGSIWLVAAVAFAVIAAFAAALVHVVRRQSQPVEVPYGVAISLAALWVMAERMLPHAAPGVAG